MPKLVLFVLDVVCGRPVQGMSIHLSHKQEDGALATILTGVTEADGCLRVPGSIVPKFALLRAEYDSGVYFSNRVPAVTFREICVDFGWEGSDKLVLGLVFSAHSYTVYRGS